MQHVALPRSSLQQPAISTLPYIHPASPACHPAVGKRLHNPSFWWELATWVALPRRSFNPLPFSFRRFTCCSPLHVRCCCRCYPDLQYKLGVISFRLLSFPNSCHYLGEEFRIWCSEAVLSFLGFLILGWAQGMLDEASLGLVIWEHLCISFDG